MFASKTTNLSRLLHGGICALVALSLVGAYSPACWASATDSASDSTQQSENPADSGAQQPPDASDGSGGSTDGSTPPDKPEGDDGSGGSTDGSTDGGTPPDKPEGDDGGEGQAPGGDSDTGGQGTGGDPGTSGPGAGGNGTGGQGTGGGSDTQTYDYTGTYSATVVADGEEKAVLGQELSATDSSTNVALSKNGGTLGISDSSITKSGDSSDDDACNFYGVNSAVLAVGEESSASLDRVSISSYAEGANAVFATNGALALVNETSISTTSDNSRGMDATYGGTIVAASTSVSTTGDHSAAFATDRGGGNVSAYDCPVSTTGSGSPLIYSTGTIEVSGVYGAATGSQIAGMEGLNAIRIFNSTLESTVTGKTASDPVANGIIIYQSTSGDADTSAGDAARFEASNSTLKSAIQEGAMFYCTNTTADVVLSNTTLDFDSTKANLVTAAGNDSNSWGSAGSNGATVSFTGIGKTLSGKASADTISSLSVYLLEGTTWTGATEIVENSAGSTSSAPMTVSVDATSTWVVTEDCTVSALSVADGGRVVDADGNAVTIVAGGSTVVQGSGSVTVTVEGEYTTSVETTDANQLSNTTIDRSAFDSQFDTSTTFGTDNAFEATIDAIADQTYTGSAIEPAVTVTVDGKTLVEDTDYTVTYANNVEVGTALAIVSGKGSYTGTKTVAFKIVAASDAEGGSWETAADGTKTYRYADGELAKGKVEIDGATYFFNETTGAMETGFKKIDKTSGKLAAEGSSADSYDVYYFRTSGEMVTGLARIYGYYRYFGDDGVRRYGEQDVVWSDVVNDETYADGTGVHSDGATHEMYFDDSGDTPTGTMLSGYVKIYNAASGKSGHVADVDAKAMADDSLYDVYYYRINGEKLYGLAKIYGYWRYLDPSTGIRLYGLQSVKWEDVTNDDEGNLAHNDGETHEMFFDDSGDFPTGIMASGVFVRLNADGASDSSADNVYYFKIRGDMAYGLVKVYGYLRYFGDDGVRRYGWQEVEGKTYYFDNTTGAAYTGTHTIDGKTYTFGSDGVLVG